MESGQVLEKSLGEYRERMEFGLVPKKGPGEYWEMVESGQDVGKMVESRRVPEKGGI